MYTLEELSELLSPTTKSALKLETTFTELEAQTVIIAGNNTTADITAKPLWLKLPFVWILEYLAISKITSVTPEYLKIVQNHYRDALNMLNSQGISGALVSPKIGTINGLWEV